MKITKFGKIYRSTKAKCKKKKWLLKKLNSYAHMEKANERFCTFECSVYFRGATLARINSMEYRKDMAYISKKIRQIECILEKMHDFTLGECAKR